MQARVLSLSALLALLLAPAAGLAEEPTAPPAAKVFPSPAPREVWYGWQTLTIAGASLGVGTFPAALFGVHPYVWPLGLGGVVLGGPIVHWKHGRVGRGFAVLGMNVGGAALGMGLSMPVGCVFEKCDGIYFQYLWAGSYLGALIGVAIDAAFLSKYEPPEPREAALLPRGFESITPMIDVRPDRTVLGVRGLF
ncbi:hypothetical protein [Polyangium spumosum]|uniref:Uncharacterized protein n=1 Tax=Polyangium spumosum TaxID=889282 RepID=A0A6N7PFW7_9BACT|nr:hypothetical protein [Polyangium spumosum]MRG91012.1 hypothetical protein [Polyangium spumosum]